MDEGVRNRAGVLSRGAYEDAGILVKSLEDCRGLDPL